MSAEKPRLLILAAHPDDAEFHAGGLAVRYRRHDRAVKMVSVTDGAAGHHEMQPEALAARRRLEAQAAAEQIGAEFETWDYPDGALLPSLELRLRIIREIRKFQPHLVLTHRTCDYHPDHRAVGQCVQDASYMVTVPLVLPEVPHLPRDPVVAYMPDLFTRPNPLRPDIVLDISAEADAAVAMLACHVSQVFEFLPYNLGIHSQVPSGEAERLAWLKGWNRLRSREVAQRFRAELKREFGDERGGGIEFAEVYEISEYAAALAASERTRLFPTPP